MQEKEIIELKKSRYTKFWDELLKLEFNGITIDQLCTRTNYGYGFDDSEYFLSKLF